MVDHPERKAPSEDAKTSPPTANEWQDFVQRTVLRLVIDGWLTLCLGDLIDELTPGELERIALSKDQIATMSAPIASLASKSKLARRHGRMIISASESVEAVAELGFWMRRVYRIARRHRPTRPRPVPPGVATPTPGNGATNGFDGSRTIPYDPFVNGANGWDHSAG